uniref:Uncharacterized protein n=1 Tax=Moniliophthora roreri TaxID=221103 RepID=A0A0W0FLF7_MONRR
MSNTPPVLNVHTPSSSFAIVHSINQDSLEHLYDKLTRKVQTSYHRKRVGPGWLKYEFNATIWNLDDDSDYTIFAWRQQQQNPPDNDPLGTTSVASVASVSPPSQHTLTLHLHDPTQPLPTPPEYINPQYYVFQPSRANPPRVPSSSGTSSRKSGTSTRKTKKSKRSLYPTTNDDDDGTGIPKHKREFEQFHSENGVRTVMGSIGPVKNGLFVSSYNEMVPHSILVPTVRMLLKSGYRHVYISRKFALEHGFIPADAAPGLYGYGGLVNIGTWPITLTPSLSQPDPSVNETGTGTIKSKSKGPKPTMMTVYLSEEPHFDVVLGRSFFEKRSIRTSAIDMTDVVCLDTGEKIECELVILKDGRGEIVTVT